MYFLKEKLEAFDNFKCFKNFLRTTIKDKLPPYALIMVDNSLQLNSKHISTTMKLGGN